MYPPEKEPKGKVLKRVIGRTLCEAHLNRTDETLCCQVTTTRGLLLIGGATLGARPMSDKLRCYAVFN